MVESGLILKRSSASRPSGEWNDDDFDVLADGVAVGRIMKGGGSAGWEPMAVDAGLRTARRQRADARLRADARGRDGGVREELAKGVVSKIGKSAFGGKSENICSS
jgi:hypothetical protein